MPSRTPSTYSLDPMQRRVLIALVGVAVIIGTVARFKGLGKWPFGVDEYYFAKSVQDVLRVGVPAFECGGYYVRGILLQYLSAGLQLLGVAPELAPRSIAAATSLLALPAAFLLGRRINGTTAGLLAVALLAISVWQVEMGRFGRFYAPFQTVFLWYLVCFVRYTVDERRQYAWGMALLSVVAVLVWEGGVLLAVANLLPPFINHDRGRLTLRHWRYLAGMGALLLPLHWFATADVRRLPGALPPDFEEIVAAARPELLDHATPIFTMLTNEPGWLIVGLLPLAIAAWALRWIASFRGRWLAAAGLLVALLAALLHQVLVFIAVLALLLLLQLLTWRDLLNRQAVPYLAATLGAIAFWITLGLLNTGWHGDAPTSILGLLSSLGYQLAGFPNVLDMVARPWAQAIPLLSLSLFAMLLFAAGYVIVTNPADYRLERTLLVVAAVMLLLIGAADAPRLETRYAFFLYPLLLINAICVMLRVAEPAARRLRMPALVAAAIVLGWFAVTEDFKPRHLANIDSAEINFRIGMKPRVASHYYGRGDIRAAADWLRAHADSPADLVISGPGIASLDFYYSDLDFVYVDPSDHRLDAWSCQGGTVERWSNLPLVYSLEELAARISTHGRSFLVIDSRLVDQFLPRLEALAPTVVWENPLGTHAIVMFESDMGIATEPPGAAVPAMAPGEP